ncbi:MAG: hypothetical protein ACK6DP_08345 [Gemmatimonas sp.]|jgi:hypothetical protein|uniref:hypothetical protein n=1 Tax=Gemmatimonas sp. TaxID=1962908 RepID=UPI00391F1D11|nr:hypothetical protein [Gemmatimonadota bacterium]
MPQPPLRWPVRTLEHVDLWLHGFALLSDDSATVPLYRRGYRDSLVVEKNRRNILTALDGNRAALSKGLQRSGYLDAQFLPFAFSSWEEMRGTAERFLQFEGDPRRAPDRALAQRMAVLASVFRSASDREWLRLFVASVHDEHVRFFNAEHTGLLRTRAAVITAVDSLWQQVYRMKFERFLNNTGQRQGDLVLSLPIGGEGRTGPGVAGRTMVAVPYPARVADAPDVLHVVAHEITGSLVAPAVADNVTPAEQRAGTADRYVAIGQVQAGVMLLTRIAPELVEGYQRYYLAQVGERASALGGPPLAAAFASRFPLPPAIQQALTRQIDIVLSGI